MPLIGHFDVWHGTRGTKKIDDSQLVEWRDTLLAPKVAIMIEAAELEPTRNAGPKNPSASSWGSPLGLIKEEEEK